MAVVVEPDGAYGVSGYQAYPYSGFGRGTGWTPGSPYYDMPYTRDEASQLDTFEANRVGTQ